MWWIKRDMRLADNAVLRAACDAGTDVVPLYVYEPTVTGADDWSGFHAEAVARALAGLARDLEERGARLVVAEGGIIEVLEAIVRAVGIQEIVAHEETGLLHTYRRDEEVRVWAPARGIVFREYPTNGVVRALGDRDRRIAIVRERFAAPQDPPPERVPQQAATIAALERIGMSTTPRPVPTERLTQDVTEASAHETLGTFLDHRAATYQHDISAVERAAHSCSRLSVHLAWGTISVRQVVQALEARRAVLREMPAREVPKGMKGGLNAFRSRIYWHDHFVQRLEDEPDMELHPLNRAYEAAPWVDDHEVFEAWHHGETGYPMVDACIRSFRETGWLNFRMRAMLVSFACHVLHLPWRTILMPMARLMADYVPGIHVSQTQMQAGVIGINTIRIYNPTKQLRDHDPETTFVRAWISELRDAEPQAILGHVDEPVGGYQEPIVDYAERSKAMRSALWSIKSSKEGRAEAERVLEKHGSRKRGRRR